MIAEIFDYLMDIQIIDTHEHLPAFEKDRPHRDVISEYLAHYFRVDLINAGLSPESCELLAGDKPDILEKWMMVEKFWEVCRYTGYGQALAIAAKDIYGIDRISRETIEELNNAFTKSFHGKHYKKVLKEMSKIRIAILDTYDSAACDPDYFISANHIDNLVQPQSVNQIEELGRKTGVKISTFENYLTACGILLGQFREKSPILKCALAYSRSLDFAQTPRFDAEAAFNHFLCSGNTYSDVKKNVSIDPDLSNYLFRYILEIAQEKDMIMQIHTGLLEGNGNILENGRPTGLNKVFLDYPHMRFDLFHIGYPYQDEIGALCKMFPNVYIDMCWAHVISPVASRRALGEWLELLPYNRISGFGGDYLFPDGVYGHQYMARRNIAEALSDKVEEGLFSADVACHIGKAILYDNPTEIFGIAD